MGDARIQSLMTIAGAAFAVAQLTTLNSVTYQGYEIVSLLLMLASFVVGLTAVFEVYYLHSIDNRIATGGLEMGIWIFMLGLTIRFVEVLQKNPMG